MYDLSEGPFQFKFYWLDEKSWMPTTTFRKRGQFDGEILKLDQVNIYVNAITDSEVRDTRLVMVLATTDENEPFVNALIMLNSKKTAQQLKTMLDIARSRNWAEAHKEYLQSKGLERTYREAVCPVCSATIALTGMAESPQLYCHFCHSLTTLPSSEEPAAVVPKEERYKICHECGMYSRPQKFTIFYFYFLIVFYGWWSQETWRCPGCMRKQAWKMLFGNMPFVLGVPVAITQLVRCYTGDVIGGPYKGLDAGNTKARKGKMKAALDIYLSILSRVPNSAGIKYNVGVALLAQGELERAAETFERALEDCSNYVPAYQQLRAIYTELGDTGRLAELDKVWQSEQSQDEEPEAEGSLSA